MAKQIKSKLLSEEIQKELVELVSQICNEREEKLKQEELDKIAELIIKSLDHIVERKVKNIILRFIKPVYDELTQAVSTKSLNLSLDDEKWENLNASNS